MTAQPRTPTTEAGRAMLERESLNSRSFALITPEAIAAIEAEARADALDEGLLATALEGWEVVPYKPSPGDDYEAHRQGAAKVIAAAYRLAAYRASQERV